MSGLTLIYSATDPRIQLFSRTRDRQLATEHNLFVAEGEFLVHRLLTSGHRCKAILVSESRAHKFAAFDINEMYVATEGIIQEIVGFKFHRGVLALGYIPSQPLLKQWIIKEDPRRLVVCPEINDPENLGAILRSALAFGYQAVLLGSSCCQPYVRRAIRTSMGAIFHLPLIRLKDIDKELLFLRLEYDVKTIAAVTTEDAIPLKAFTTPERLALMLGTEAHGLPSGWIRQCDYRICIPMHEQSDSLNVAVAAGIFMYALA
ncbi:RNA methyltransferase [candidate division KSB1 bacterium]|nr:RNA methyltransferase [candidate division KSB1 bacterium]